MVFVLGGLACLGLWWFFLRNRPVSGARLRRVGAWAALALAALFLLRGQIGPALALGLGGVWLLEGAEGLGRRVRREAERQAARLSALLGAFTGRGPDRRLRAGLIEVDLGPDAMPRGGRVLGGPFAGARLEALTPAQMRALLAFCAGNDADGARLLEAYLDGRQPGWRVDAEADRHAGPGRPPQPGAVTEEEAHQILGLERGATGEEIRAAHRRLMKSAHPDQGGNAAWAARVNAARDRLTNRHR